MKFRSPLSPDAISPVEVEWMRLLENQAAA